MSVDTNIVYKRERGYLEPSSIILYGLLLFALFLSSCTQNEKTTSQDRKSNIVIDTNNALKNYQILLTIPKNSSDTKFRKLLEVLYKKGNYSLLNKHLFYYQKTSNNSLRSQGITSMYLGEKYIFYEKFDSARICFQTAIPTLKKEGLAKEYSMALIGLAYVFDNEGSYDKSIQYHLKALRILEKLNAEKSDYFHELGTLGISYFYSENNEKAIDLIDRSLKYFGSVDNKMEIAFFESAKAAMLFKLNKIENSFILAKHSLELRILLKDTNGQAESYNNLALSYSANKDYQSALYNLEKSKDLFYKQKNIETMATILMNIAFCLKKQNKFKEAIKSYLESIIVAQSNGQKSEECIALNSISETYNLMGDYKNAYMYQAKFIKLKKELLDIEKIKSIQNLIIKYEVDKKEQKISILQKVNEASTYKFYWIVSIIALVCMILLFLISYLRSIHKREKISISHQKELEELENRKKIKTLEIQILHAQMNPHFVFNCLSAIQHLFMLGDQLTANSKLSSFSRLLRMSIDHVKKNFVSLEDEMKFLKYYIELEKLQFDVPFEYNFINECSTNLDELEISTMILQPFVENSINHGLRNKLFDNRLEINLSEDDLFITVIVSDNGVGRAKATEIKNLSAHGHVSKGLLLVKEKIEALKELNGIEITIETIDLFDDENNSVGTKVIFIFPKQLN